MINLRETEIRNDSLELVVEAYRVANLITDPLMHRLRLKLIDCAFRVSSSIAKAFIALQDEQFETDISQALIGIELILGYVQEIESEKLLDLSETKRLQNILATEQEEFLQLLATSQQGNSYAYSPKLEKACI